MPKRKVEVETARLEARIPVHVYEQMQRAADLCGLTLTDYLIATAGEDARRIVEDADIVRLAPEDQVRFAAMLSKSHRPNERLSREAKRHVELIERRSVGLFDFRGVKNSMRSLPSIKPLRIPQVHYSGRLCMYPCAGSDIAPVIRAFGHEFDTFLFVDLSYAFRKSFKLQLEGWAPVAETRHLKGPAVSPVQFIAAGKFGHRDVEPAWLRQEYRHVATSRTIEIVLRRGFGEYALHELADGSLDMFIHRGDSLGEGGSGVTFLGNQSRRHTPLSCMLSVLKRKLAFPALIASDGSNTPIKELRNAAMGDDSIMQFSGQGLAWERVGSLEDGHRKGTVVWRVSESGKARA